MIKYCFPCSNKKIWKYDYEEYCNKLIEAKYQYKEFLPMCEDCFTQLVDSIEKICKTKVENIDMYKIQD